MSHTQLAIILSGAKLYLPFDIDLKDKDKKNMFYEMIRFIIMIDEVSWQPKNQINLLTFKIKKLSGTQLTFRNDHPAF